MKLMKLLRRVQVKKSPRKSSNQSKFGRFLRKHYAIFLIQLYKNRQTQQMETPFIDAGMI